MISIKKCSIATFKNISRNNITHIIPLVNNNNNNNKNIRYPFTTTTTTTTTENNNINKNKNSTNKKVRIGNKLLPILSEDVANVDNYDDTEIVEIDEQNKGLPKNSPYNVIFGNEEVKYKLPKRPIRETINTNKVIVDQVVRKEKRIESLKAKEQVTKIQNAKSNFGDCEHEYYLSAVRLAEEIKHKSKLEQSLQNKQEQIKEYKIKEESNLLQPINSKKRIEEDRKFNIANIMVEKLKLEIENSIISIKEKQVITDKATNALNEAREILESIAPKALSFTLIDSLQIPSNTSTTPTSSVPLPKEEQEEQLEKQVEKQVEKEKKEIKPPLSLSATEKKIKNKLKREQQRVEKQLAEKKRNEIMSNLQNEEIPIIKINLKPSTTSEPIPETISTETTEQLPISPELKNFKNILNDFKNQQEQFQQQQQQQQQQKQQQQKLQQKQQQKELILPTESLGERSLINNEEHNDTIIPSFKTTHLDQTGTNYSNTISSAETRMELIRQQYKEEKHEIFALLREFETKISNVDKSKLDKPEKIDLVSNLDRHGYKYRFYSEVEPFDVVVSKDDYTFRDDFKELDFQGKQLEEVGKYGFESIPTLKHGLERTILSRGVHPVNGFDGKPNFSNFLSNIHDFDQLTIGTTYMIPSEDKRLVNTAIESNCKYLSSTSSITAVLSHLYFLVTNLKPPPSSNYNTSLEGLDERNAYMPSVVKPCSIHLIPIADKLWGIDNNSGNLAKSNGILMNLGHSMEKMLTLTKEEFEEKLLKENVVDGIPHEFPDAYIYSKFGSLMYRSQLDCKSDLLPEGRNTFDLKTRATNAIRMNVAESSNFLGHQITRLSSGIASYEKEYYDLSRSGAIKYCLQARIGHMAGIFICYHNTKKIFGSEYIDLEELEKAIFHTPDMAERSFQMTNTLLEQILNTITKDLPMTHSHRVVIAGSTNHSRLILFIEKLETQEYPHLEFEFKTAHELTIKESEQITNPVRMFEIKFGALLNGKKVISSLHYAPEDEVRAFYKITELFTDVKVHYAKELRGCRIYTQFS